jgi:DNA-binding transcriptional MerR regulator
LTISQEARFMNASTSHVRSKSLRIGELAARTGRSVHAIRWYETQGLIPGVIRDAGGRRSYRERHLNWLVLIDRLRLTGMTIAQMRDYAALVRQGRGTLKQQHALLLAHRERVEARIKDLTAALHLVDHKIELLGEWIATGIRPEVNQDAPQAKSIAPGRRRRSVGA